MAPSSPDVSTLLSAYDYFLPPERIAQEPAREREDARLMALSRDGSAPPTHHAIRDLPALLRPGDLLVRNDVRVFPARLRGERPGGGKAELFLLRPLPPLPNVPARWLGLARPAKKLKPGTEIRFARGALRAEVLARLDGGRVEVAFDLPSAEACWDALEAVGEVPLPPYIRRGADGPTPLDRERYQTTYARVPGAVAAPTAGLHFTPALDARLRERGVEIVELTLKVGAGTFRSITVERLDEHVMEEEAYAIPEATAARINAARREGRRVIAVGTTTTRVLETATDDRGATSSGEGVTHLFIRPGHRFRGIDGLFTNFHLPKSSLLVLVAAFAGRERVLAAYAEAVRLGYRFYSYGDAMLILG